jgi:hypothetical protein
MYAFALARAREQKINSEFGKYLEELTAAKRRETRMSVETTTMRSPGAERMRRHRGRRQLGLRCLTIELRETEIDLLIRRGRLAPDGRGDLDAVKKALYAFLDDALR